MKLSQVVALAVAAACLASCGPTRNQYEVVVTALEGSSRARNAVYANCLKKERTTAWKKEASVFMNVSEAKAPAVFCQRALDGLVKRRITFADVSAVYAGDLTPNIVKVLQGR
ncbi:Hypothetical protein RG1141_CH26130 [Neorhizobium galegae bv. officinalis bv. officinalis str. HAMBI 1141]|uniref:Lipoprotein n=1 Tax=Neorhizobium galegae bv. officinalis bv. officinalis str. HAMBI 1141 TaxID=1028801 RepID=A0A068TC89_NEOGA|nr:hypothetical protein [Neorhizobium sp. BETTINA12A]MCJ9754226.1 hypothetical protein [Neorhizobium sp. BETTINA12A]CDN54950.1 Hypothetical protein RG1141_CH26130 [Neorhizobium galegae bv. officinalis bv. officinalis str. HAMBI 1141]